MAIIAISRGTRSGGQAMAECLAEELGYPILGREVAQEASARLGVSEEDLSRRWEVAPKLWEKLYSARKLYAAAIRAALAEHAAEGNLVYHGLAGQLLLRGLPAVLRVRLIASEETRLRTLRESSGLSRRDAERYLREVDEGRARWVKSMYGENIHDPALYDVVMNLDEISVPLACGVLANTVRQTEFDLTDEARTRLREFRLECRVKLALASADDTRSLDLEVDASGGTVEVSGSVPLLASGQTGDRISEIANSVSGVTEVRLNVEWYDPYP
ncbi:cytidylate kinase family protein [Gemmatimonadota bacterium]